MIKISREPGKYMLRYDFDNVDECNFILDQLTKRSKEFQYWNKKYVEKSFTHADKIGLSSFRSCYGFVDILLALFHRYDMPYQLDEGIFPSKGITILPKWVDILSNPEYGANGYTQYQYLYQLLQYNIGIGKFVTGFGKTEMQLAIAESYASENPDKHVLFILPSSLIIENTIARADQYKFPAKDIETGEYGRLEPFFDVKSQVTVINPNGFMRSSDATNPEVIEWLSKVGLVIMDEVHNSGSASVQNFFHKFLRPDFIYGFSATPDKVGNSLPRLGSPLQEYSDPFIDVISLFSIPKSEVRGDKIKKDINLVKMKGYWNVDNIKKLMETDEYNHNESLFQAYSSIQFAREVQDLLEIYKDTTFYLPVPSIELGRVIRGNLLKIREESLDSKTIISLSRTDGIKPEEFKNLNELKDYINSDKNECRLLITSQLAIESMDIANISGVFMTYGKIPRITLQSLGRARAKEVVAIFTYAYGNPILIKQANEKIRIIKDEFKDNIKSMSTYENGNLIKGKM